jgi:D-serine dehydratase
LENIIVNLEVHYLFVRPTKHNCIIKGIKIGTFKYVVVNQNKNEITHARIENSISLRPICCVSYLFE